MEYYLNIMFECIISIPIHLVIWLLSLTLHKQQKFHRSKLSTHFRQIKITILCFSLSWVHIRHDANQAQLNLAVRAHEQLAIFLIHWGSNLDMCTCMSVFVHILSLNHSIYSCSRKKKMSTRDYKISKKYHSGLTCYRCSPI